MWSDLLARPMDLAIECPRAASTLVELAVTCPGLYYFATSWLPVAENYRYHLPQDDPCLVNQTNLILLCLRSIVSDCPE